MDLHSEQTQKPPVVRGARACTTCRAAKMKCVGAEDGHKQCQRCKRANVECIFEKHRRGRKPGSKLSEASKMLRRLEKGLNSAKSKAASVDARSHADQHRSSDQDSLYTDGAHNHIYSTPNTRFTPNQLPPLNVPAFPNASDYTASSNSSRTMDVDEEDSNPSDRADDNIFPVNFIQRENARNSFFRTILNPEETPTSDPSSIRGSFSPPQTPAAPAGLTDPVSAGLLDEEQAKVLFDLIFLRLNPFINLFDPSLHSVPYVRNKSPFLFTVLLMAGCKFFKPELFKQCQKLANEFAVQAFSEALKSVEVVQAFACLTYWQDPDNNRTWTFIGYACRMAVELGLNRYVPHPPPNETDLQLLERRNRERTYLVLFTHDRSLSTQTGRNWMLPEDDFIRHADRWHERPGGSIRPEDVIVAAFVQLRHIAAETTEIFHFSRGGGSSTDINHEVVLRNCNSQLTQWAETWNREMQRAGGDKFHFSFLSVFRLYVRLFTNSFGIQDSSTRATPSVQALSTCYTSALDSLKIICNDFASMSVLRYGQESLTTMSAYSAVFLLRLLRSANTLPQLHEGAATEAHAVISKTADAYHEASLASSSAAYHARFLRGLLFDFDLFNSRKPGKLRYESGGLSVEHRMPDDELLNLIFLPATQPGTHRNVPPSSSPVYPQVPGPSHEPAVQQTSQNPQYQFAASPQLSLGPSHVQPHGHSQPSREGDLTDVPRPNVGPMAPSLSASPPSQVLAPVGHPQGRVPPAPQYYSESDQQYWINVFTSLGFGGPPNFDAAGHHIGTERNGTEDPYHMRHPNPPYQ